MDREHDPRAGLDFCSGTLVASDAVLTAAHCTDFLGGRHSGGPLFHDGTVVAINTWTFSWRCDGPNLEYPVDAPIAQAFLNQYL